MVRFWRGALAGCSISHPLLRWPLVRMRHRVGNVLQGQGYCESIRASPHNPLECGSILREESTMRVQLAQQAQEILGQSDLVIITERVDDVALLIGQMVKMGFVEVL